MSNKPSIDGRLVDHPALPGLPSRWRRSLGRKVVTWWKEDNAQAMLALRICRFNGLWDEYWQQAA